MQCIFSPSPLGANSIVRRRAGEWQVPLQLRNPIAWRRIMAKSVSGQSHHLQAASQQRPRNFLPQWRICMELGGALLPKPLFTEISALVDVELKLHVMVSPTAM